MSNENKVALEELNKVDGFHPAEYLIEIQQEGSDQKQVYLPVQFRKLWFRLKYPNGKIAKKIIALDEKHVIIEARIYTDIEKEGNAFISSAFAIRYFDPSTIYGQRYLESAETAAVGRALQDAGFGTQFAGDDLDELTLVDTPTNKADHKLEKGKQTKEVQAEKEKQKAKDEKTDKKDVTQKQEDTPECSDKKLNETLIEPEHPLEKKENPNIDSQEIQSTTSQKEISNKESKSTVNQKETSNQESQSTASQKETSNQESKSTVSQKNTPNQEVESNNLEEKDVQNESENNTLNNSMSEAEIKKHLTLEEAKKVKASIAFGKGRTLGELMKLDKKALQWIKDSYVGPDKIMKVAAQIVWEQDQSAS